MSTLDYILALALLTSPPESLEQAATPSRPDALVPALQTLAIQWEILDPREVRYILARPEDYVSDLNLLRRRYLDLADAPPAQDSLRFPDRSSIGELLAFNWAYRQHLEGRRSIELMRSWDLHEAIHEAERLHEIWDTLRDARCDYYYVTFRRQALKKLRDMIGEEAYYSGCMPPHVPLWRFQRVD